MDFLEAIGWHILDYFNLPLKTKRIIFHEVTKSALQKSIQNPTIINMNNNNTDSLDSKIETSIERLSTVLDSMNVNKTTEAMNNVSLYKVINEDFNESLPVKWFIISFIIVITLLSLSYYINTTNHSNT